MEMSEVIVSRSVDGRHILLGEVKWSTERSSRAVIRDAIAALARKGLPPLCGIEDAEIVRVVFVPDAKSGTQEGVHIVNAEHVLDTCLDAP